MTTENNRADALTDAVWRLKRDLERGDMGAGTCLVYMADLRTLLAASPVEQPAAAPIDDARECLMDVVSHHDNIVAGFAAQRLAAEEAQDRDTAAYWKREIDVAHRMKAQAERSLAAMVQPAPSPADERAAFERLKDWPKMAPREVFYAGWRAARTASASETGRKGRRLPQTCEPSKRISAHAGKPATTAGASDGIDCSV